MYGSHHTNHTQDSRDTQGKSEFREKYRPLPGNDSFQFPSHQPSRQNFFHGPISAPAVTTHSDDYFSWATESVPSSVDNTEPEPDHLRKHGSHEHKNVQIPLQGARPSRRLSSSNKIRHRSNLSNSYMDEGSESLPGSLFARPEHFFGPRVDGSPQTANASAPKSTPKPKANKNPGFFIKLDDLKPSHSSLHKVQHQHRAMTGPVSDPNGTAYEKMELFESDVYLQQSETGGARKKHENITPLMFPPNSEDLGYFGQLEQPDHSSTFDSDAFPGGYLNVTSKVHDPIGHSGTSGNNSDIDSYLNFPVDTYTSMPVYDKDHYEDQVPDYPEEMENTKVEAHFTPISGFHHDHSYSQNYEDNSHSHSHSHSHHTGSHHYGHDSLLEHNHKDSDHHFAQQDHKFSDDHGYHGHNHDYLHDITYNHGAHEDSSKNTQEHFNHSYMDSRQEHIDYHEEGRYQNAATQHHQTEDDASFMKYPSQQSFDDFSYEKKQARLNSDKNTDVPLEVESPSDSQSTAHAAESSDTDQVGSSEKKTAAKKRKGVKGIVCSVCGKLIVRDFSRHIRIHDEAGRFQCLFPQGYCKHKSRKFNRPYDYKKHLLNVHFKFDDASAKLAPNLTEKLHVWGQCNACGERFLANEWLEGHILTTDLTLKCYELQRLLKMNKTEQEPGEL